MATLHLFGELGCFRTFAGKEFSLSHLADIDIEKPTDADFVSEIADEAIRRGDGAAAAAAMTALARYEKEQRIGRLARPVLRLLGPAARHLPYFRRFAS
jgi:hypothetical protein